MVRSQCRSPTGSRATISARAALVDAGGGDTGADNSGVSGADDGGAPAGAPQLASRTTSKPTSNTLCLVGFCRLLSEQLMAELRGEGLAELGSSVELRGCGLEQCH